MCMRCEVKYGENETQCVATLSLIVCARHVQWYTQCGTQRPNIDPHSQLVGVQCLLVHLVLVFLSFPIYHIVNTATETHL